MENPTITTIQNPISVLSQLEKDMLKARYPEHFAVFEQNPPTDLHSYVIGATNGKYKLDECNDAAYSVVCPSEGNREIMGGASENSGVHSILHWLWFRWNKVAEKQK